MTIEELGDTCESCNQNANAVSNAERDQWLAELNEWEIVEKEGVQRLVKAYISNDFTSALTLANEIAELAEAADHHPELLVEWGKVTVSWWTHSLKGLHKNDFVMAALTDQRLSLL